MSKSEAITVQVRQEVGKRKVKRLRAAGMIPAVIYGHGKETTSLSVPAEAIDRMVHDGERIVSMTGGMTGDAFIREVQWDVFGNHVIHVDFAHVEAGEMLSTTVALQLRGNAPGLKMGGQLEQPLQEMELLIPPRSMTDRLDINVNELELGQKITVGDLTLPEGSEAVLDAGTVVVQCVEKVEQTEQEEEAPAPTGAEPEVIGGKKDDGGDDS